MVFEEIQDPVEQIAEALMLLDAKDLQALADLHTRFSSVAQWASSAAQPSLVQHASRAAELIEDIILEKAGDPAQVLEVLGRTVSAFQAVVRDGRDPAEAGFPEELAADTGAGLPSAPPTSSGGTGKFAVTLPAYVDEAIFSEFLTRQVSVLDEIEGLVLGMEKPEQEGSLAAFKRIIHTLKGEAGLLGLSEVQDLCHAVEDMLAKGGVPGTVDVLLGVKDWLGRTFDSYAGKGSAPSPVADVLATLKTGIAQRLAKAPEAQAAAEPIGTPAVARQLEGDTEIFNDFVIEANDHLQAAEVHLLTLETEPKSAEAINAVFRAFHTIKGVAGYLRLNEMGPASDSLVL